MLLYADRFTYILDLLYFTLGSTLTVFTGCLLSNLDLKSLALASLALPINIFYSVRICTLPVTYRSKRISGLVLSVAVLSQLIP
jgi:hypothetical protein